MREAEAGTAPPARQRVRLDFHVCRRLLLLFCCTGFRIGAGPVNVSLLQEPERRVGTAGDAVH